MRHLECGLPSAENRFLHTKSAQYEYPHTTPTVITTLGDMGCGQSSAAEPKLHSPENRKEAGQDATLTGPEAEQPESHTLEQRETGQPATVDNRPEVDQHEGTGHKSKHNKLEAAANGVQAANEALTHKVFENQLEKELKVGSDGKSVSAGRDHLFCLKSPPGDNPVAKAVFAGLDVVINEGAKLIPFVNVAVTLIREVYKVCLTRCMIALPCSLNLLPLPPSHFQGVERAQKPEGLCARLHGLPRRHGVDALQARGGA